MAENAPKTAGRRFTMLQAVLQPGMSDNPAKFEETWITLEHQVDVYYENFATSKLDDDENISIVLREAPQKLRDHLLVNSQQFENDYNKLKAIIQAYLNTNKTWIASDFRESDPMDFDHTGKGKSKSKSKGKCRTKSEGNSKGNSKGKSKGREEKGKGKSKSKSKGNGTKSPTTTKSATCAVKKGSSRTKLLVTSQQQ